MIIDLIRKLYPPLLMVGKQFLEIPDYPLLVYLFPLSIFKTLPSHIRYLSSLYSPSPSFFSTYNRNCQVGIKDR